MILTPRKLQEIGRDVWGPNWRAILAARLGKTKRTIERYASGKRRIPARLMADLTDAVEHQLGIVAGHLDHVRSVERDQL